MKKVRYSEWSIEDWDDISLVELMSQLSDYLLQSGFTEQFRRQRQSPRGQSPQDQSSQDQGGGDLEEMLEELREAIKEALLKSDLLDEEQWSQLFDENGEPRSDKINTLVEQLLAKLLKEGFINLKSEGAQVDFWIEEDEQGRPRRVRIRENTNGKTEEFQKPQITFEVTEKGSDFLGYKSLQKLLGGVGRSSFGRHTTDHYSTGVEAYEATKDYEFGDTLNLDASATLLSAISREGLRTPLNLTYQDLKVRQAEYQSSCATVLMLDCSHSMILYGEDRFTPAKQVSLALSHLIRSQYPGDTLKLVLFHDAAEEVPLSKLAGVQVGPYHTNTCEGLKLARRLLAAQKKDMKQIIMITDGKPSALFLDEDQFGRKVKDERGRRLYKNAFGLDPVIVNATLTEAANCRRSGIMINTFMLTNDYYLIEFVRELTEVAHGKAYFTNLLQLGEFVLYDFVKRKMQTVS